MRLATWNVNSIRQRQGHVERWLARVRPDVLVLQETKCEAHAFPEAAFAALGYQSAVVGQKSYNGVAALVRGPFEVIATKLPGLPEEDAQARYIEIEIAACRVIGIYLPNGNSGGEVGYAYKLSWMRALRARAADLLEKDMPFVVLGDYNVAPTDDDYAPGALPKSDALVRPETRAAFHALMWLGLTDAIRAMHPRGRIFTFWDYQSASYERDSGLRIDHALCSPIMADRLVSAMSEMRERAEPQPSDHVPVICDFA